MNILRLGTRILTRTSPVGLIIGGTALALAIPPVRRGLRSAAIAATRGILSITDEATRLSAQSRETVQDMVAEATGSDCCPTCNEFSEELRSQPRRMAVAAAMGAMAVSDKAKSLVSDARQSVKNILYEAKFPPAKTEAMEASDPDPADDDGLEGEFADLPKH